MGSASALSSRSAVVRKWPRRKITVLHRKPAPPRPRARREPHKRFR
jgi:hypothetical protein